MTIEVSHPDRVIYPEAGHTKADIVDHYLRVGDAMLAFLANRPLTLQRFPKGIGAKGFMQKNAGKHFPASIGRYPVPKRDGTLTNYPVVTQAIDLAYLANQGTLTFHMWTATIATPDRPDWLVIDLDPEADDLDGVRFATHAIRAVLADFGLQGFVLATGSKGFHVWVPLDGATSFGEASVATRALAGIAVARHNDELTTEFLKKNRRGRVFVDWLRNTGIATVVVPFSLRPRPGLPWRSQSDGMNSPRPVPISGHSTISATDSTCPSRCHRRLFPSVPSSRQPAPSASTWTPHTTASAADKKRVDLHLVCRCAGLLGEHRCAEVVLGQAEGQHDGGDDRHDDCASGREPAESDHHTCACDPADIGHADLAAPTLQYRSRAPRYQEHQPSKTEKASAKQADEPRLVDAKRIGYRSTKDQKRQAGRDGELSVSQQHLAQV